MNLHEEIFGKTIELTPYENQLILMRDDDQRLIGYVLFQLVAGLADLHYLVVAPRFRRLGYGARLLEAFWIDASDRGAGVLTLEVRCDNQVAIRLYERFGFEMVHVRKNYYQDGCDAFLMKVEKAR